MEKSLNIPNESLFDFVKGLLHSEETTFDDSVYERLSSYISNNLKTRAYARTLLNSSRVPLTDIYYQMKVEIGNKIIKPTGIKDFFQDDVKNTLLIGDGGGGKTTLLNYAFINSIENFKKIPIIFDLRLLNGRKNISKSPDILDNVLFKEIKSHIFSANMRNDVAIKIFKQGRFVFILDGFDELPKNEIYNNHVESFVQYFLENNFLMATRKYSASTDFLNFNHADLLGLSIEDDLLPFIQKQTANNSELFNGLEQEIRQNKKAHYLPLLSNPLFVILFIRAFDFHPNVNLSRRKTDFYSFIFEALYYKHDGASKGNFIRPRYTEINGDLFKKVLFGFCYVSFFDSSYEFDNGTAHDFLNEVKQTLSITFDNDLYIKDLLESVPLLIEVEPDYKFVHRTVQEYFAAQCILKFERSDCEYLFREIIEKDKENLSDYIFLLEIICEENENLFVELFFVKYFKTFCDDYIGIVFSDVSLSGDAYYDVLKSFYKLRLLVGFSDKLSRLFYGFLQSHVRSHPTRKPFKAPTHIDPFNDSQNINTLFNNREYFVQSCMQLVSNIKNRNTSLMKYPLRHY